MKNKIVQVSGKTCKDFSQDLFDFSSFDFNKNTWRIIKPCKFYLNNDKFFITTDDPDKESVELFGIKKICDDFWVYAANSEEKVWRVIQKPENKSEGHKIDKGDLIKIGKVLLNIKDVGVNNCEGGSKAVWKYFKDSEEIVLQHEDNGEDNVCRICLSGKNTEVNPLISPCKCSGTMKKVHLNCLKEWISNKVFSRISKKTARFMRKDLNCELCHHQLPIKLSLNNRKIHLFDFPFTFSNNFIALKELNPTSPENSALHIISLPQNESAILGRSSNCDISLNDVSVSRKHCYIQNAGTGFYLNDMKSKYGTMVESKADIKISKLAINLKIRNTIFKLSEKINWVCFCRKNRRRIDRKSRVSSTYLE